VKPYWLLVPFFLVLPAWPQGLEAVVTTDLGSFRFEFAPDKAPKHVEQFIKLAREGYYDGSAFHYVIANGIIQGGDPLLKNPKTPRNLWGTGGMNWGTGGMNLLPSELSDLKHERGVVSTFRIPNEPNSDGSQFFVCVAPQPTLDGQFSTFGRVTEGMDVVERISQVPAGENGFTEKPVRILKIAIENKKVQPFLTATPDEMRKTVTLKTTLGSIKIKMEPDWAPDTVRNFLMLTSTGWYNGTIFHRIAKDFVVQGGTAGQRSTGPTHPADRWVHPIKGEFRADVKHVRGIVSMARGDDPNSATTSFFLMLGPATHLDGQYAGFGRIVEGIEVLDAFEKEEREGETPKRRLEIVEASIDSPN
jgi:cyclophilin family peptidyl-prolyl cis-trans isomerase